MNVRPYKFVVQAVIQRVDGKGDVDGEVVGEAITIFGCEALAAWAKGFTENLAAELSDDSPKRSVAKPDA